MPAVVLRIKFTNFRGKVIDKQRIMDILNPKLTKVDQTFFENSLKKIYVWEKNANENVAVIMKRSLGTFALGELGQTTSLGIFVSNIPDYLEFWICSSKPKNCIKGRKCLRESLPNFKNGIRKSEVDTFLFEGGDKILREGIFSKYVRGDFNVGFICTLIAAILTSVYNYSQKIDQQFNYLYPLLIFGTWLTVLFIEILYHKGKGIYIVK